MVLRVWKAGIGRGGNEGGRFGCSECWGGVGWLCDVWGWWGGGRSRGRVETLGRVEMVLLGFFLGVLPRSNMLGVH